MIQLNLLPDVKLEYIKSQREHGLVIAVSALAVIISLGILVLNIGFGQLQKKHLNDVSADIISKSHKLQSQPQITKILTVQNQLKSLTSLHDSKPASDRMFGYLNQLTPVEVSISSLDTDFTTQTVTITGSAKALSDVNRYVDTLKFTNYTSKSVTTATRAFSNVVLTSFSVTSGSTTNSQPANYSITLNYDPIIFTTTDTVKLNVLSQVTTRSEISQPNNLFEATPKGTQ